MRTDDRGLPTAVGGRPVAHLRDEWRVEEGWWTRRPLRRRYFDLVLEDGRNTVVFLDRRGGAGTRSGHDLRRAARPLLLLVPGRRLAAEEMAERAAELGYDAFALTDHDSLCGSLEFAHAARDAGLRPITGCELTLADGSHLTLLVEDERGYRNLCRLITLAHADDRRAPAATLDQLAAATPRGCTACPAAPATGTSPGRSARAGCARPRTPPATLRAIFGRERFSIELQRPYWRGDARRNRLLAELAERLRVAAGRHRRRARPHARPRLSAGRAGRDPAEHHAGRLRGQRRGNHESVLRSPAETAARFPAEAVRGAARGGRALPLRPDPRPGLPLSRLRSETGEPAQAALAAHLRRGARAPLRRLAHIPEARARLEQELELIDHPRPGRLLPAAPRHPRDGARGGGARARPSAARRLLPPGRGRGSSVGSIVCYLIGLSHVDPVETRLFLGRFLSPDLASVPDIDLDFPRDVREGLILEVHRRYGADHAALVAAFPTYKVRGAIRDLGKALALPQGEIERMARLSDGFDPASGERRPHRPAARLAPLAGLPLPDGRDRRPAPPPHPALGRDGDLLRPAGRAGAGDAGRHAGPPDLPVGQGLLRRRRLPQDRPARPGHALGGRGVRRPDRAHRVPSRSTSRASDSTTPTCSPRSRRPTRSACSRSRAAPRCSRWCRRSPRTSTT